MNHENEAADLLIYYMRQAWTRAGLNWEPDNSAEMRILVDHLMDAVDKRIEDVMEAGT